MTHHREHNLLELNYDLRTHLLLLRWPPNSALELAAAAQSGDALCDPLARPLPLPPDAPFQPDHPAAPPPSPLQ